MRSPRPAAVMRFVCLLLLLRLASFAQDSSTGGVTGVISDPTGARIALATVVLANTATGLERTQIADVKGNFAFSLLAPGAYTLRADAANFASITREIPVEVGGNVELSLVLPLAGNK